MEEPPGNRRVKPRGTVRPNSCFSYSNLLSRFGEDSTSFENSKVVSKVSVIILFVDKDIANKIKATFGVLGPVHMNPGQ